MDEQKINKYLMQEKPGLRSFMIFLSVILLSYLLKPYASKLIISIPSETLYSIKFICSLLVPLSVIILSLSSFVRGVLQLKTVSKVGVLKQNGVLKNRLPWESEKITEGKLPTLSGALYDIVISIMIAGGCYFLLSESPLFTSYFIYLIIGLVIYIVMVITIRLNQISFYHIHQLPGMGGGKHGAFSHSANVVYSNVYLNVLCRPTILVNFGFIVLLVSLVFQFLSSPV